MEDDDGRFTRVCVCVCVHNSVYQYTADSLCGAGLLTVRCPVQRDLALAVWDPNVGIVLDQKANVFRSVIESRPMESSLLHRERVRDEKEEPQMMKFKTEGAVVTPGLRFPFTFK